MTLPTDQLFPPTPRAWADKPGGLLLKLLLALTLAAAYDAGAIVLAIQATVFHISSETWGVPLGLATLGVALGAQLLLLGWLLVKQRYVLAGVVVGSAIPLAYVLLLLLS